MVEGFNAVTVTLHVAVCAPAVTVMVAVPAPIAVTVPLLTVATDSLLLVHIGKPGADIFGIIVAVRSPVAPSTKERLWGCKLTLNYSRQFDAPHK